jgi:molybdopterin/thiamine biosynthesis adenylyltransferase
VENVLKIGEEDRFARFGLIGWWDQRKLAAAKVLVIGAGALGNEIMKNLALLGVGNVFVVDLDTVENSNLSRSVLFRAQDCGRAKVDVAADAARNIYPEMRVRPMRGNAVYDLGLGLYRWADVIIGGLDNREARVAINRSAARAGKIWIDGAIERLNGVARVFDPAVGPCYECTMGENDWKELESRRSCALLSRAEMQGGKVPTTPTTASVIAGVQCQEAVKLLHGLPVISGQGFVFDGTMHQSYLITYNRRDECPAHEPAEPLEKLQWRSDQTTLAALLEKARKDLGSGAILEFGQDLLEGLDCPACGKNQRMLMSLSKVTERDGKCPACSANRVPRTFHTVEGKEDFLDKTLAEIGLARWDVVGARVGMEQRFYEMTGDQGEVLGELAL